MTTGIKGIAVYVMVYTFMNLGAFLVLIALRRKGIIGEDMDDIAGLMQKSPGYALLMLIFLLSLAGIPPTAGFLGKYYIFLSLIETHHYTLAVIATLYVAVAIYYYFRIVRSMFVRRSHREGAARDQLRIARGAGGERHSDAGASASIRSLSCGWRRLRCCVRSYMDAIIHHPLFTPLLVTLVIIALFPLVAGYIVLIERKVLADFQVRLGPMRVGPARPAAAHRGRLEAADQGRHHPHRCRPVHFLAGAGDLDLHRADCVCRDSI